MIFFAGFGLFCNRCTPLSSISPPPLPKSSPPTTAECATTFCFCFYLIKKPLKRVSTIKLFFLKVFKFLKIGRPKMCCTSAQ